MTNDPSTKRARDDNDDTQEDHRPAKRVAEIDNFDNLITILVGPDEHRFMLHQDAICGKSKFFKAACSKKWREGQERVVRLPEVDPSAFKAYCAWVYSGTPFHLSCTADSDEDDRNDETERLIDLYLLGDTLDDIELRHTILPFFPRSMQNQQLLPSVPCFHRIYDSTLRGSLLRKALVEAIVSKFRRETFAARVLEYPPELVQDVAVAAMEVAITDSWKNTVERIEKFQEVEDAD